MLDQNHMKETDADRDEQEAEEKAVDIVEGWNNVLQAEAREVEEE